MSDTQTAAPAAPAKQERPDLGAAFIATNKKSEKNLITSFFYTII